MDSKDAAHKDADSILCCISALPLGREEALLVVSEVSFAWAEGGEDNTTEK